ncbi:family 43 glycosylhydrolase, partial [Faecalibacillus intestinalis]|uniref:family 43 glycosylhydrolase n=1 Tax=Faecalibacillus intestinalis TaxID=1982626 RepID=UPI001EE0D440
KAAQAVPLTADGLALAGPAKTAWEGTGERCSEGPHIMKKDGYYYAIVAEGGTGYGHGINVGRSKNFYGPYECSPYNPVMRQKDPT